MPDALVLPDRLDLSAAAALHAELVARKDTDLMLDMEPVTHIGALCLQVLIAAARHAKAKNTGFDMRNINDCVVAQMRVMGTSPATIMEGQS